MTREDEEKDPAARRLFGHAPRSPRFCPGCEQWAEPYIGRHCWLCWATGRVPARAKKKRPAVTPAA